MKKRFFIVLLLTLTSLNAPCVSAEGNDFSKIPEMTVLIGDKAYNLDYANDPANEDEIQTQIGLSDNKIFIKDPSGEWIKNESQNPISEKELGVSKIIYKDKEGKLSEFLSQEQPGEEDFEIIGIE